MEEIPATQLRVPSSGETNAPDWLPPVSVLLVLFAGAARLRSLLAPLALDDYTQRSMIDGQLSVSRGPLNLFEFVDDRSRQVLLDRGGLPWWSDPHLKIRFLRPLPSALTWLDFRLWGYGPLYPHVESYLVWLAAVAGAYVLFRSVMRSRAALLAALAFAFSPAFAVPLVWLANRDVLVTVAMGVWALRSYVRWRESGRARDEVLAAVFWSATVLTGEYALCLFAYPVAFELLSRSGTARRRLRANLCVLVPVAGYLLLHALLGYGVAGSGFYRNPFGDLARFVADAPRSFGVLFGAAWLGIDDRWASAQPNPVLALVASLSAGALAVTWVVARAHGDERERAHGAWLGLGALLSLIPLAAAQPSTRLLGVTAIGASATIGLVVDAAWTILVRSAQATSRRGLTAFDVLPPILSALFVYSFAVRGSIEARAFATGVARDEPQFDRRLDWVRSYIDPSKTVVVLRSTTPPTALAAPFMLRELAPKRWRVLTQTFGRIAVVRSGPRTLEVLPDGDEPIVHFGPTDPVRAGPMREGQVTDVGGMQVTVLGVDGSGAPTRLRFEFDRDLDDASFWWIAEGETGYRDVTLPMLGQGVWLQR